MLEPAINHHRRGITLVLGTALPVMLTAVGFVCRRLAAPAVVTDRPPTRIGRKIEQGYGLLRQAVQCLGHGNRAFSLHLRGQRSALGSDTSVKCATNERIFLLF